MSLPVLNKIRKGTAGMKVHGRWIAYIFLTVGGFLCLYPIIFMVLGGLFTAAEYSVTTITLFPIAKEPTLDNLLAIFNTKTASSVQKYFFNSVFRTAICVVLTIITTTVCGYAFGRLRWRGRRTVFLFLLFTTMLPTTVSLVPKYLMYARWPLAGGNRIFTGGTGIINTWAVYFIESPAINIIATFFMKQYFEGIPYSLDEAAKLDGAGPFTIMFRILLPLAKPAAGYIAITTSMAAWNDWSTGFFFTSSDALQMLPSALSRLSSAGQSSGNPDYPSMLTLGLANTIPALIIYFIFQKNIVEGISTAGLKE